MSEHTLDVPGARLRYELRGAGPVLAIIGAPMAAPYFAALAEEMATEHTVLTYDPRGLARSPLTGPAGEDTPELRADDVRRLIDAAGGGPADVFGSSGGAVTGLALVTACPELVRTLVAHEPPVIPLLPDAAKHRAWSEDLVRTYHEQGPDAAMHKFMADLGVEPIAGFDELPEPVLAQIRRDNDYFFGHQLLGTSLYEPDIAALKAASSRVVVGVGATSTGQLANRTARALAEQLGTPVAEFPGDHGGFMAHPREFAAALKAVLNQAP